MKSSHIEMLLVGWRKAKREFEDAKKRIIHYESLLEEVRKKEREE